LHPDFPYHAQAVFSNVSKAFHHLWNQLYFLLLFVVMQTHIKNLFKGKKRYCFLLSVGETSSQ